MVANLLISYLILQIFFAAINDAMSVADSAGSRDRASKASRSTGGQIAPNRGIHISSGAKKSLLLGFRKINEHATIYTKDMFNLIPSNSRSHRKACDLMSHSTDCRHELFFFSPGSKKLLTL